MDNTNQEHRTTQSGPLYVLALVIILSLISLAAVLFTIFNAYYTYKEKQEVLLETKAIEVQILYYNGLMNNAAQMHVLTQERKWRESYAMYRVRMEEVFEKLEERAPRVIGLYAEKTNSAHDRIMDIHHSAFLLADAGFTQEALDLIIGYEHQTYSEILDENLRQISEGVDELVTQEVQALQESLISKIALAGGILLIVSLGWIFGWFLIKKWQRAIVRSEVLKDQALHSLEISSRRVERSRAEYQAVIEYAADGIMTLQSGGEISSCNKSALLIFKEKESNVLSKTIQEMIPDILRVTGHDAFSIKRYVQATGSARKEYEVLTDDGQSIPIELSISRIYFEGRESYTAMIRDISAEKQAESERRKSDAKSQFLANMSHELRTPMNGVIGMTDLLLQCELESEQEEFACTIKKSAESLQSVINDILDFSKIEAGALTLEPVQFCLSDLVDDVADIFAASAEEKGVDLAVRFKPGTPRHIMADPGRIKQILTNLVNNAIKFTDTGHILINVQEYAHITGNKSLLKFEVEDTGIGIPKDRLADVFGRFTQADESTTRKFGGTGLGLAICKQLSEIMNGDIGVSSLLGEGSTFWFTVEISKGEEDADEVKGSLEGMRVLSISHKSTTTHLLKEYMEYWGVDFVSASTIEEAECLPDDNFDAIIREFFVNDDIQSDLKKIMNMKQRCCQHVSSLALVPISLRGDYKTFEDAGFSSLLSKPFKDGDIHKVLKLFREGGEGFITSQRLRKDTTIESESSGRRDYHVLVVEDDVVNQKVAEKIITGFGCSVEIAGNGKEALTMIDSGDFDLVLMDMQMPVMDGLTATRILREHEANTLVKKPLHVIALTANASKTDKERCLEVGMNGFLTKPVTSETVLQAIEAWERDEMHDMPHEDIKGKVEKEEKMPDLFSLERFEDITMGDEELQKMILVAYEATLAESLEQLRTEPVGSKEWIGAAHKLKGSSWNIGANALAEACATAEMKPGDFEENGHMKELEHIYSKTLEIVHRMRKTH